VKITDVGAPVRYLGREGFVSGSGVGAAHRVGDNLLSTGAYVEVTLSDGKGPAVTYRLSEDEWDVVEILPA
jgi:hypothetical protein